MGNWLDKPGLTQVKDLLSTKFGTKVDKYTSQPGGKFLQTDNNGNAVWGDAASPTAVAAATEDWLDEHVSGGSTIAIDDTLTVSGAAGDAKAIGDLITVSNSSSGLGDTNKLWINDATPTEVEVPTMGEFNELKSALNASNVRNYNNVEAIFGKNLFNRYSVDNIPGKFINSSGTYSTNANYGISHYIPVTGGAKYTISTYGSTGSTYSAFYDENFNTIQINNSETVTAPNNAKFLKVSYRISTISTNQVEVGETATDFEAFTAKADTEYEIATAISERNALLNQHLKLIETKQDRIAVFSDNLFNKDTKVSGKYINDSGAESSGANYSASAFIPVIGGENYHIQNTGITNTSAVCCWYDANKVKTGDSFYAPSNPTQSAPSGAWFLRISLLTAYDSVVIVRKGTTDGTDTNYVENSIPGQINAVDKKYGELVGQVLTYTEKRENVSIASATTSYPEVNSQPLRIGAKYFCFIDPAHKTGDVQVCPSNNSLNHVSFDSNGRAEITATRTDIYWFSFTGGTYSGDVYIFEANNDEIEAFLNSVNYAQMLQCIGKLAGGHVPIKTSELINDAGFVTSADVPGVISSRSGVPELSESSASVPSGSTITIDDFPRYMNKDLSIFFYGLFDGTFTGIKVGNGYQSYRGRWIEIDGTNVIIKTYESSEQTVSTNPHGLTISEYIAVRYTVDNNGSEKITINTLGGTYTITGSSFTHNGILFASVSQAMTNVLLKGMASGLKKPMWMIGDSYFGFGANRVMGNLLTLGYTKGLCIDALAGLAANGAYPELQRMLALGTPKYLVWAMGMNTSGFTDTLPSVISLCEANNTELILLLCPSTPVNDRASIRAAVLATDCRYVDENLAVGASEDGSTWYTGYLSDDEIHPTEEGAMAIAMRYLVDIPEIAEFVDDD